MTEKKTKKAVAKPTNRKGTLLWTGLFFFVSLWMFILGVLVGRGTAPVQFDIEQLQKELAALKIADLQKEIKRYKISASDTHDKPDLDFHEALKSAEAQPPGPGKSGRKTTAPPPKKKKLPTGVRRNKPADKPDELLFKAMNESGRLFTVQVASSQDMAIADKMVDRLKAKGYPAYRETARIPGRGVWHRIRIGGFRDRTEADRFLATLRKDNLKGIVLKR